MFSARGGPKTWVVAGVARRPGGTPSPTLLLRLAREQPEEVREPVHELPHLGAHAAAVRRQGGEAPLRAARNRAGAIERGRERISARRRPAVEFQASRLQPIQRGV